MEELIGASLVGLSGIRTLLLSNAATFRRFQRDVRLEVGGIVRVASRSVAVGIGHEPNGVQLPLADDFVSKKSYLSCTARLRLEP